MGPFLVLCLIVLLLPVVPRSTEEDRLLDKADREQSHGPSSADAVSHHSSD